MPYVEILTGERQGHFLEVAGNSFFIGRDLVCDLRIDDGRTSRKHCEIFLHQAAWRLKDLGSSNGTTLNGQKIDDVQLQDGAEIGVGSAKLIFRISIPAGQGRATPRGDTPQPGSDAAPGLKTLIAGRSRLISGDALTGVADGSGADLRCLLDIARTSSAAHTPEAVLKALGKCLVGRLSADRIFIFLGQGLEKLAWSASEGTFADDPASLPVSSTVTDRVFADNLAVLMSNPESDPEFAAARSIEVNRIVTALAAPISSGSGLIGVIYADRIGRGRSFSSSDLELVAAAGLMVAGPLSGAEELVRIKTALGDGEMLGASQAMLAVKKLISRSASAEAAVLITGESGTGKELVARGLHAASGRREAAFEVVNCAALAENLIESEIFGHVKGAFTGASAERIGRFELADKGTLFLDEIGELSTGAQAKLLRVLEYGELSRVGESKVRKVDVRVIAATNRDLDADVAQKRFRQDLFYRLNVLRISLPLLRQRGPDIEMLLDHFLAAAAARMGRKVPTLEAAARDLLLAYSWPGNVREMRNLAERLVILSGGGTVCPADLPPEVRGTESSSVAQGEAEALESVQSSGQLASLNQVIRQHILRVLEAVGNNKKKAAEVLGIDRSTLYARLKDYGDE
jgi:transcriptional regulator with GAF, ATPase, and Fis domain